MYRKNVAHEYFSSVSNELWLAIDEVLEPISKTVIEIEKYLPLEKEIKNNWIMMILNKIKRRLTS